VWWHTIAQARRCYHSAQTIILEEVAVELPRVQTRPVPIAWKQRQYQALKRALDFTTALIALICLSPMMAFIALLIKLDSPGPAWFIQVRIGKDGRPFGMYKYRSLRRIVGDRAHQAFMAAFVRGEVATRASGRVIYKPFDKSELTRIGSFLRRTSLDELPQLINVLKGEMSLVGPRPNVLWEVEAYKEWHKRRLTVLPGITGLAQVSGRSGLKFDTIVQYDIEYVEQQSLGLDIKILVRTLLAVFNGQGAH
jgi:lipopolysaccharide/colanic/teichoic acid biosynthesis glycosyltransferase